MEISTNNLNMNNDKKSTKQNEDVRKVYLKPTTGTHMRVGNSYQAEIPALTSEKSEKIKENNINNPNNKNNMEYIVKNIEDRNNNKFKKDDFDILEEPKKKRRLDN